MRVLVLSRRSTSWPAKRIAIERHTEIDDLLAEMMFNQREEVPGSRWWG